jgi:hypothetical protein
VVVNRVNCLTPEEFAEEVAAVLKPDPSGPYPDGLHTICAIGKYTIIDGARRTFVLQAFVASIAKKAVRLLRKLRGPFSGISGVASRRLNTTGSRPVRNN